MKQLWHWDEQSTRNCIHAKVVAVGGTLTVQCGKGHKLRSYYCPPFGYGLSHRQVILQPRRISKICSECTDFEHDEQQED